jgi:hypothetical protein
MFGFLKSKKADVLSHWYTPVTNFTASTQEFYTAVEKELQAQKVPGLEMSRVEFAEGGILSDKRTYLRMMRERLVFDVCAAPFGVNYFYSCRFAELPTKVNLFAIVILLFALLVMFVVGWRHIGFLRTCFLGAAVLVFGTYTFRNLVSLGLADLDAALLKLPLFGSVYERFFRKETYYRQDTRLMYLTVVEGIVKKLVEQETAAKGVKLVTQYEYAPILGDLYKARPFGTGEKREVA